MKKTIFLILAVISFCCITAAASEDVQRVYEQPFSAMTDSVSMPKDENAVYGFVNKNDNKVFKKSSGVFGKNSEDISVNLYATGRDTSYFYLNTSLTSEAVKTDENGKSVLSFGFSFDENANYIALSGEVYTSPWDGIYNADGFDASKTYYDSRGKCMPNDVGYLTIYQNKITVFKDTYTFEAPLAANEWHKMTLIIGADNTYSAYVDEMPIAENETIKSFDVRYEYYNTNDQKKQIIVKNETTFRGFKQLWLGYYAKSGVESNVWFDDLRIDNTDVSASYLPLTEPEFNHSSAVVNKYLQDFSFASEGIYLPPNLTVSEFLDGLTVDGTDRYGVAAANGEEVSGDSLAFGKYLFVYNGTSCNIISLLKDPDYRESEKPSIYVEGYDDEFISLEYSENLYLTIITEHKEAEIESVKLIVDDSAPIDISENYRFDISKLGIGEFYITVIAENADGMTAEKTFTLKLYGQTFESLWKEEFNNYTTTSSRSDYHGIFVVRSTGANEQKEEYFGVANNGDEYGDSVVIGIDKDSRNGGARANVYLDIPIDGEQCSALVELDAKFSEKGNGGRYFSISLKDSTGGTKAEYEVAFKSTIQLGSGIAYNADTWYHIALKADIEAGKCYVTVTDKATNETIANETIAIDKLTQLDHVRFYARREKDVSADSYTSAYVALDNVSVSSGANIPSIVSVSEVMYNSKDIIFTVSDKLSEESVTSENIRIVGSEGEFEVAGVVYDKNSDEITVTISGNMRSLSEYRVILMPNIKVESGIRLNTEISRTFTTGRKPLETGAPRYVGGSVAVDADNNGNARGFVIAATVFDGTEIVKSYAKECYISENEKKEFNMTVLPLGENQHIEMYVWDSLTDKNLLIYDVDVH